MNRNSVAVLYKERFVILHFSRVFDIILLFFRNDIRFLMTMRTIMIAKLYRQIDVFGFVKNQRFLHYSHDSSR